MIKIEEIDIFELKQFIIQNDLSQTILEHLGYTIIDKGNYLSFANLDGDNPSAIVLYKDTLKIENYTRGYKGDIITLVEKTMAVGFIEALDILCSILEYKAVVKPETSNILKKLAELEKLSLPIDNEPLEILDEKIYDNYEKKANRLWLNEGIEIDTQAEFEIQYCNNTNTIIIPIKDDKGRLVGIKNRKNTSEDVPIKYFYSYPVKKNRILYGLYKTKQFIKEKKGVIVFESEKSVMKAWQYGIKNSVAISGSDLSLNQVCMLEALNVQIMLCFDKDKKKEDMDKQLLKFIPQIKVSYVLDDDNLLGEKDAPIDSGINVFKEVCKNRYKL